MSSRYAAGQTALVIAVGAAEPVVGAVRAKHDPTVAYGIVPHVTVMHPFLPAADIDDETRAELARVFASVDAFDATFARCGRFPGLVYLAPEPAGPFRALTAAITERWPTIVAYEGKYGDPEPHMSVAFTKDDAVAAGVCAELEPALPFATRVERAELVAFNGSAWESAGVFPLGG
ncbi:MAG TPA: 2'-5' RNA ligase family protein [Stackebrandtia sp.]|jgi:2'-5' RNA ligase|uniref:2'-5' RNA ligase family protein n=1 Tax=Stackebrandtia sp. TaxID=2023065 RepID=UPI002D63C3A5|nr:2'-5' RNA ligase family protein [Stackebrandtia sp.]HZE38852.1 2'-5' RNA ligase family protein [Stackebrandtia sp.]